MKPDPQYRRLLDNWHDELNSAAMYDALAAAERDPGRKDIFAQLAQAERRHAEVWRRRLEGAGLTPRPHRQDFKTRLMRRLIHWFGPAFVISSIAAAEYADRNKYAGQPDAAALSSEERGHAAVIQAVADGGPAIAGAEPWHRGLASGNDLRAAVLGVNDGLVSNFCLVMGVAGASASQSSVLLTGCAGLIAGALSMALGEWLSVTNARELASSQLGKEAVEIEQTPDAERHELALIYRAKGLPKDEAERIAGTLMADRNTALDAMAREELGIDPKELGGRPWRAAGLSLALFSLGALMPILPFTLFDGRAALIGSAALSALALFAVGAVTSLFNGRSALFSALRQTVIAGLAAAITYGVGHVLGASLSG